MTSLKRTTAITLEEALMFAGYCADHLTRPNLDTWDESYEGWLYRNGLLRRYHYLEAQKFIERQHVGTGWVWKLTATGQQAVHDGRHPEQRWNRPWDGWWRLILFDLPVTEQRARSSLVRWLRAHGFGYLQDSVWISPDPVATFSEALKHHRENAASFTILESRCAPGFTNSGLVTGAWPFDRINDAYRAYEAFAADHLSDARRRLHPRETFAILRAERAQWRQASDLDPLLPRELWPTGYRGPRAWQRRGHLLTALTARCLRTV